MSLTTKPRPGARVDWGNPINRGLVSWWLLNEGAGSRLNDIAGGNDGVLTNMDPATDWVGSPQGGALDFDGENDHVVIGTGLDTSGPITISFWNHVTTAEVMTALTMGGVGDDSLADRCTVHAPWSDNTLFWDYGHPSVDGRISTDYTNYLNKWTHLVLVSAGIGGSFKAIYLDGILIVSDSGNSDGPTGDVDFNIVNSVVTVGDYHDGRIGNVQVYNRVLTALEAEKLYHNPYGGILRRRLYFVPAAAAAAFMPDNRFRRFAPLLAQ